VQRTQRVAERLPEFYRSWDREAVLYRLIDAFARSLNEQQQDIFRIARTHWVETAYNSDLDAIGAAFDLPRGAAESDGDYRARVKSGVQRFRGGGTRESVVALMAALLRVRRDEIELNENPSVRLSATRYAEGDAEWSLGSMSVEDAAPRLEVWVEANGERIVDPTLGVREIGAAVRFRGTIAKGQRLVIERERAELDGQDVSNHLERTGGPVLLLRSGSTWSFHQALSSLVGTFDHSIFDGSVFQRSVPRVGVRFEWTSRQPSSFELVLPRRALERGGYSLMTVEDALSIIRAQGVRATVRARSKTDR
jgi:hypothetical protein